MPQSSSRRIMELSNVNLEYPTGGQPFQALKNVNLDILSGEFLGITGKSGAGKTTLLNMITGVSNPTDGEVVFMAPSASEDSKIVINHLEEDDKAKWRGDNLGIIYQSFELLPNLDLIKNINLPPDFLESYNAETSPASARILLEQVEILEHSDKIPAHISGGQKQRVAIARALVNDPSIIVADEPTGNLDSFTAEKIYQIFEELVEIGKTIVMVTHDAGQSKRFSRHFQVVDGVVSQVTEKQKKVASAGSGLSGDTQSKAVKGSSELSSHKNSTLSGKAKAKRFGQKMNGNHPAVILQDVSKIYESPAGRFVALESVDLNLDFGQFVSIVGKSGSGKSTLINMITGIDHPSSGKIMVANSDIYKLSESDRALWRGRNMGVVFQFFQLLPSLTILENIMLPMDYCDVYSFEERPQKALDLLEKVGMEEHAYSLPGSLSTGQQQSAAIARALANDPSLILADEPTGNLDSRSAETILKLFEELASQGKTVLIVTHDTSITSRTDQTIILSDGEIVDEEIAIALPYLSHPLMLKATKEAQKTKYSPGDWIFQQGESVDHFYMVAEGFVDIVLQREDCDDQVLAKLGPGQFFGEVELFGNERARAAVRSSAESEVLISKLPKSIFAELINESSRTESYVSAVAKSRSDENSRVLNKKC